MPEGDGTTPSEADLDELYRTLSNWGRWGVDDELGALNHLTSQHRAAAATGVVDGTNISLAHDLGTTPSAENPYPAHHHMLASGDARDSNGIPGYEAARDYVGTDVHGLGVTHVDALSHMFVRGEMYNGIPASEVRSTGARRNTVLTLADGVVGRGVLLDVSSATGGTFVPGNGAVRLAQVEEAEERQGVRVGAGDILMVSTGRDARRSDGGGSLNPFDGMAGLHPECLPWLHEREVAMLGSDGISDPMPGVGVPNWPFPIHQIGIVAMGLHLIDNMALGRLTAACAERQRWSFLFVLSALRIPGGTGCPANPIAVL